ncbi:MAG: sialate O-acetylesterase [Myxococcota bacterium]
MRTSFLFFALVLPLPIFATANGETPLKVFVLAGQSNMVGAGQVNANPDHNGGAGSLEQLVKSPETAEEFRHLVDEDGAWRVRDDVYVNYFERDGGLTVGYGSNGDTIGPELGFGTVVGDHFDEPVLLIKVAWGGKSLAQDFRPPSRGDAPGPYYTQLFDQVRAVLGDLEAHVPGYAGQGYELAGFGWHQGWNDRVNQAFNDEYEENLAAFIRDLRAELEVEDLPFVIAETGMHGPEETHPRALSLMRAQAAVAEREEFADDVAFVPTRALYRPPEQSPSRQGYHWNGNAETYYRIGAAMGEAMLQLVAEDESPTEGD